MCVKRQAPNCTSSNTMTGIRFFDFIIVIAVFVPFGSWEPSEQRADTTVNHASA
jgi:hypothetical protein